MTLSNILAGTSFQLTELIGHVEIGFLEEFIGILIGAVGITGIGIILYCLILKIVVLPLDIWQKASMRKQNLKMESMRGQLEKLKAQYENNPELYQKKIQEVYKQNNYNMFSSCLPTIAMLVILMVAFQSLTTYSQYMNLNMYVEMSKSYNTAILQYYDKDASIEEVRDDPGYICYKSDKENCFIYAVKMKGTDKIESYDIDVKKMAKFFNDESITEETALSHIRDIGGKEAAKTFESFMNDRGASFLLTKNIFYPDVMWSHPLADYNTFKNSINKKIITTNENGEVIKEYTKVEDFISADVYNSITSNLTEYESQPNGYFILVVLTILANLGSQFISMRSQKAQRELQTADKSQQDMQKWMMLLMPAMFCFFAFIYSGAFSLYLITSSLFSTVSMLVVNKVIDTIFNHQQKKKAEVISSGRQAYTRDWEKNKKIDELKNKYGNNNKNNNKK